MTTVIDRYSTAAQVYSQALVPERQGLREHVPCAGCTSCCQNELLYLHEEMGDKPEDYETDTIPRDDGTVAHVLKHQPNGDCVYLDRATGCTIHDRAPAVCREFDCRRLFLAFHRDYDRASRRAFLARHYLTQDVLDAGKERLTSLPSWMNVVHKRRQYSRTANLKLGNLLKKVR